MIIINSLKRKIALNEKIFYFNFKNIIEIIVFFSQISFINILHIFCRSRDDRDINKNVISFSYMVLIKTLNVLAI